MASLTGVRFSAQDSTTLLLDNGTDVELTRESLNVLVAGHLGHAMTWTADGGFEGISAPEILLEELTKRCESAQREWERFGHLASPDDLVKMCVREAVRYFHPKVSL